MSKRRRKLEAPEWKVDFTHRDGELYVDISRIEHSTDSLFYRLERQSWKVPMKMVKLIQEAQRVP